MTIRSIAQVLEDLGAGLSGPAVSVEQILEALHERGFGFLLLIFALPMALPVPVPPGINILLASPLVLLTAQQALGRHSVWLPRSIKIRSVSRMKFQTLLMKTLPWVRRAEFFLRPRLAFVTRGAFSHLIGLLGLVMALTVCIPVPLTNTVPSLGIALMAAGVIMRDGLAVLAGALIGSFWIAALIFFGAEGFSLLKEALF